MSIPLIFNLVSENAVGLLTVFTASVLGAFADAVFEMDTDYASSNIWTLLLCIGITVVVIPVINLLRNINMLKDALAHDRMVYGRFLDKEYAKAVEIDSGEVQYRLEDDPIGFRYYWMEIITKAVVVPVTTVYLLRNAVKVNLLFTLITFAVSLIKLVVPIAARKKEAKYDLQNRQYNTDIRSYETEITTKPFLVKLFGLKDAFCVRLDARYRQYYSQVKKKDIVLRTVADNIASFVTVISTIMILLIGSVMVANGSITAGSVAAMVGYLSVFDSILYDTGFIVRKLPVLKNLSERLLIFYTDKENVNGSKISPELSVSARNVSFAYNNGRKIISSLDFSLPTGKKIALCGANGSGKSTLIKILSGLEKGYSGSIKVNGVELNQASLEEWRSQFAFALQEPYLFEGTVDENIRLGNANATDSDIDNVMQEVGILHLKGRRAGLDSNDLSGGEKQRISVARALIKKTPLLILDEPGNNLDADGLQWLKSFIVNSKKTILYISHDDALTACADIVIRL